jgi:hypothetical protein
MKQIHLAHEINCSPEEFWKLFFDPAFNEALLRDVMKVSEFQVTKFEDGEREILRTTTGKPQVNLPGPIKKIIGDGFSYTEEGRFEKGAKRWHFKIKISSFGDKARNEGTMHVEPAGEGKVRRVCDATVEAKIFGVGGMIESGMEKQMQDGWTAGAAFMNKWIAEHGVRAAT